MDDFFPCKKVVIRTVCQPMETISRHLDDLTAFHAVAKERSFTRAAEQLGASKALLSKQVKRLETYIGAQLFHRTTRALSLTEEGVELLSYSQKIFDLSDQATRRLRDMSQGTSGLIRLSAPNSVGDIFLPSFLERAKAILPAVQFELDITNENKSFEKDGIDFAIRASEDHRPDLIARYLGRIKDVICVSPHFLKNTKITDSPTSLAYCECILNSLDSKWNKWTFNAKNGDICVEVTGSYATNQYRTARQLCISGFGVARVPLYMVDADLRAGKLIQLFSEYEISTHPLYLVYLQSEYVSKKHKIVKELILKWFKEKKNYFI
jgi:DNA-binding transcriptional LysR family regulator